MNKGWGWWWWTMHDHVDVLNATKLCILKYLPFCVFSKILSVPFYVMLTWSQFKKKKKRENILWLNIHALVWPQMALALGVSLFPETNWNTHTYCVAMMYFSSINQWSFFSFLFYGLTYRSPQAKGPIEPEAVGLLHSRSNARSKPHLQPTPQLMTTPDL